MTRSVAAKWMMVFDGPPAKYRDESAGGEKTQSGGVNLKESSLK